MLLQMEKHFKSEQKARQTVEVHLEQTVLAEHNVKKDLENTIQKHSEEAQELENERDSTRMVHTSTQNCNFNGKKDEVLASMFCL